MTGYDDIPDIEFIFLGAFCVLTLFDALFDIYRFLPDWSVFLLLATATTTLISFLIKTKNNRDIAYKEFIILGMFSILMISNTYFDIYELLPDWSVFLLLAIVTVALTSLFIKIMDESSSPYEWDTF